MDRVLSVALASLHQDMSRLDRVAMNLVNASTPGYKREVVAARPFAEIFEDGVSEIDGTARYPSTIGSAVLEVALDMRAGAIKLTGEHLDLALTGDGFFEIQTENGPVYTRQGNFRLDPQGRLVTAQGHPVAGMSGDIFLTTQTPQIDRAGNITEPGVTPGVSFGPPNAPTAQIKVIRFADTSQMTHIGEGLLSPGREPSVHPLGAGQIKQGALENANISTAHEMVELIQTMRHFESVQKITRGYHDMIGTAIRRLGDLS